jgi:hypothetical protein
MKSTMNLVYILLFFAVTVLGCGDQNQRAPAVSDVSGTAKVASYSKPVRDTITVVIQETLKTVIQDTVRTVFTDTLRTVVFDTVRTFLLAEETEPEQESRNEESLRAAYELAASETAKDIETGKLTASSLNFLTRNLPQLETVSASTVDSVHLSLLSSLSGVNAKEITRIRWGKKAAPLDHPDAKGAFLTFWSDPDKAIVVHLDSTGLILH